MKLPCALLVFASLTLQWGLATAQSLPDVPPSLMDKAGVVCVKVSEAGDVSGAFIIVSTGSSQGDQDLLAWVRLLRWPEHKLHGTWFPMPVAIGGAKVPEIPATCSPSSDGGTKRATSR